MTIYVDPLVTYPNKPHGKLRWCHMMCDGDDAELHAMAKLLGLRRAWCQKETTPMVHYDITPSFRALAIFHGAIDVSSTDMIRRCVWPFTEHCVTGSLDGIKDDHQ